MIWSKLFTFSAALLDPACPMRNSKMCYPLPGYPNFLLLKFLYANFHVQINFNMPLVSNHYQRKYSACENSLKFTMMMAATAEKWNRYKQSELSWARAALPGAVTQLVYLKILHMLLRSRFSLFICLTLLMKVLGNYRRLLASNDSCKQIFIQFVFSIKIVRRISRIYKAFLHCYYFLSWFK